MTAEGPPQWARTIARTAVGTASKSPFAQATKARSVKVKLDRKVLYELDGGDRTKVKTFKVKVEPAPSASAFRRQTIRCGRGEESKHMPESVSIGPRPVPQEPPARASSSRGRSRALARRVRRARARSTRSSASSRSGSRSGRAARSRTSRARFTRSRTSRSGRSCSRSSRSASAATRSGGSSAPRSATAPRAQTAASTASRRSASGVVYGGHVRARGRDSARRRAARAPATPRRQTAGVLGWPGGTWIVGIAGVVMIGVGALPGLPRHHEEVPRGLQDRRDGAPDAQGWIGAARHRRPPRAHGRLRRSSASS